MATLNLPFQRLALPGPAPAPGADEIHIWRIDLSQPTAPRANVLSAVEAARAAAMRHEPSRETFLKARTALRLILSACTGVEPTRLPIVIDARGKPSLDLPLAPHFNLSHSGALAMIAISRAAPLGVDVEVLRPTPRFDDLAARFFAPSETAALRALPEAQRLDAFYACWTRKEAFVKADGSGIANSLAEFEVSLAPDAPARLLSIRGDAEAAGARTLHAFRPAPNAWGAVCIETPNATVTGFDFAVA